MAGIYIHIPFCKQACYYCDFYFSTSSRLRKAFIEALLKEVILSKDYLDNEKVETIYFGGGTPSQLTAEEINLILQAIYSQHQVDDHAEITLEANPDDLQPEKLQQLKETAVNRLSIGIQSFFDEDLRWMNRAHHAKEALQCIEGARHAGFNNLNIDLIYGAPGCTDEQWKKNLDMFFSLGIPHLSAYSLTVEQKTPLDKLIRTGRYNALDEGMAVSAFSALMDRMEAAGYLHYEISNFAVSAQYLSRHNTSYWQHKKYLGLGPSAHSYNGQSRSWNIASLQKYCDELSKEVRPVSEEKLEARDQYNEMVMTGLRTMWGINEAELLQRLGPPFLTYLLHEAEGFLADGSLLRQDGAFKLSRTGKFYADRISAALFMV